MLKILLILGSTRENRFGDKPAKWIYEKMQAEKEVETEFVDLRDWPLPIFDEPVSPKYNNGNYKVKLAERWAKKVEGSDGFIFVTPEYNHGYPAVLKNALDYLYKEWNKKPVAFVGYGGEGGARAIEQLRQVTAELQMVPLRNAIHFQNSWDLIDEKGNFISDSQEAKVKPLIEDLIWWTKALKNARETV